MKPKLANATLDQRRAAAKRTAWLAGAVALVVFVMFFVVTLSH